jgi:hypothetical protein
VSAVYLYAVLAAPPRDAALRGLAGEPVRALRVGDLVAAVGDVAEASAVSAATLRAHDDVVRSLARDAEAILPARFGSITSDDTELAELLTRQAGALGEALRLVHGCEQMTARVFAPAGGGASAGAEPAPATTGVEYLERRRVTQRRAREVPEVAPLRAPLDGLVRAERVRRHDTPPLLATLYHLVPRGRADDYLAIVADAAGVLEPTRVSASGPWPPYAFAPESLS